MRRVPEQATPPLPPDWLRCEMLERFRVLAEARISPAARVLEVGSGPHAITTVPLAHLVGRDGAVIAAERERWTHFRELVQVTGVQDRVSPVKCDARRLPVRSGSLDAAACVHGIRSLGGDEALVEVLREMVRVAADVFIAESIPEARSEAQKAHLAMYDLRSEVFEAATGRPDDRHYLPLSRLRELVEAAGGRVRESKVLDVDLPHALAYFPRSYVEQIPDQARRKELLERWEDANHLVEVHGADHPPVGVVRASR